MKKLFIIKAFDGRKEKFVTLSNDKKVLTPNANQAHKFLSEIEAETAIEGIYFADEVADILGKDLIRDETMFTIIPIFSV